MSTRLKTACPHCQRKLNISGRHLGKTVKCPGCEHRWVLEDFSLSGEQSTDGEVDSVQSMDQSASRSLDTANHQKPETQKTLGKLGRFELQETLGGGAYGIVYRSWDPVLRRAVALKIPRFGSDEKEKTRRFLTEAHAAANLKHPNIVAVYESGEENGRPYIASEYVKGEPLSRIIQSSQLDHEESVLLVRSLAEALSYAHREGVIHRDVKPDNVMIGERNRPQIMDFGLAKLTDDDSQMTGEGNILGTPAYMSPEQARGDVDRVGPKSDQYSLGVILYELLTGERPYSGPPHSIIARLTSEEESPEVSAKDRSIPRDLSAICHVAMEKDPEERYDNCDEMAEDLTRWLSGMETDARPLSLLEKYRRWYGKNRMLARLWITVGGLIAMMLVFASVDYGRMKVVTGEKENQLTERSKELTERSQELKTVKEDLESEGADRIKAQRNLAMNEFERGRNFCQEGEITRGLLWLTNSMESLTPEMSDLETPIRHFISSQIPLAHQLTHILPHDEVIRSVALSPDGNLLLTGTGSLAEFGNPAGIVANQKFRAKGEVFIWDLKTGTKQSVSIKHDTVVIQVAISPDGKTGVSASIDKTLKIFDPESGREIHEPIVHPHGVVGAVFNHDGTILATGCLDEYVRLWDTETWKQIGPPLKHDRIHPGQGYNERWNPQPILKTMAFTKDGKYLLVRGKGIAQPFVKIWDVNTGQQINYPEKFRNQRVDFMTPDGSRFAVARGNRGHQFIKWNEEDQSDVFSSQTIYFDVMAMSSETGILAIKGSTDSVFLYNQNFSSKVGQELQHDHPVNAVAISRDGKVVVTGGDDQLVKVWKVAEENRWGKTILHTKLTGVKFFPDGKRFLTGDSKKYDDVETKSESHTERVRIWDTNSMELLSGPYDAQGGMSSIDISPDGKLYSRGNWYSVVIRRVKNGSWYGQFKHPGRVRANCFMNDGKILVTGCVDGKIRFWDMETKSETGEPLNHGGEIISFTYIPDKNFLLSSNRKGTVFIWDLNKREIVYGPIEHPKTVRSMSVHPSGEYFSAGCNNGSVYFWSIPGGQPVLTPIYNYDQKGNICTVKFHPDGKRILIAGTYQGAQFWDLETMLPCSRVMMEGLYVRDADLSPDGQKLLVSNHSLNQEGFEIQMKDLGESLQGNVTQLKSSVEKRVGMKLEEDGELKVLSYEEWSGLK